VIDMKKLHIALIAIIVVLAFIGGYFAGVLNSAGNLTLNVTNKSNDSGDDDTGTTYKTQSTTTTSTTKKNTTPTPTPTPTPVNNSTG